MKLLTALGIFLFSTIVSAVPLHNVVLFGDSLSDNGNLYEFMKRQLPPAPPYYEGRFTNGPVWIEHLMATYFPEEPKKHLLNYAFGGAGVSEEEDDGALFTLKKEVASYLLTHDDKADSDSLFIIWIGSNNYLGVPTETDKAIDDVIQGIRHSAELLAERGARHILLVNLPDLGRIPAATEFNAKEALSYLSNQHNRNLLQAVDKLKEAYPTVEWFHFDMNVMFNEVMDNPSQFGFTNIDSTCYDSDFDNESPQGVLRMAAHVSPKTFNDPCKGHLFFDLVHPTAAAHRLMAEKARLRFNELGIELGK